MFEYRGLVELSMHFFVFLYIQKLRSFTYLLKSLNGNACALCTFYFLLLIVSVPNMHWCIMSMKIGNLARLLRVLCLKIILTVLIIDTSLPHMFSFTFFQLTYQCYCACLSKNLLKLDAYIISEHTNLLCESLLTHSMGATQMLSLHQNTPTITLMSMRMLLRRLLIG